MALEYVDPSRWGITPRDRFTAYANTYIAQPNHAKAYHLELLVFCVPIGQPFTTLQTVCRWIVRCVGEQHLDGSNPPRSAAKRPHTSHKKGIRPQELEITSSAGREGVHGTKGHLNM